MFNVNVHTFLKIYKFTELTGEMVDCHRFVPHFVNIHTLKLVKRVDLDNCLLNWTFCYALVGPCLNFCTNCCYFPTTNALLLSCHGNAYATFTPKIKKLNLVLYIMIFSVNYCHNYYFLSELKLMKIRRINLPISYE